MKMTGIKLTTVLLASAMVLPLSGQAEKVITFNKDNPTSDEILQGFIGHSGDAELPPELMPDGEAGGVKFRGIRMKNTAEPETASADGCNVPNGTISLQVKFDVNSYALKKEGYETLKSMAKAMSSPKLKNCKFLIEGHTDASGNADYNRSLSQKRAETVKTFLSYNDIEESVMNIRGMGEDMPLNPAKPYAAENRRVQFKIINGK